MVNMLPNDEQRQIVDAVSALLEDFAPLSRLGKPRPANGYDAALGPKLAELGCFAIAVAEDAGGLGLDSREEAIVLREMGRRLVSPSMLAISLAARLLAATGGALLNDVMAGTVPITFGLPCEKALILLDARADALALVVSENRIALIRPANVKTAEPFDEALGIALADGVSETIAVAEGDGWQKRLVLLVSAMACGQAEGACSLAVEYAKIRHQFGKPIGAFQAVKHRCADMAVRAERAWSMTAFAAIADAENAEDAAFLISAARSVARDAAIANGAAVIQVHGGMGFTAECHAHRFMKRANVLDLLAGNIRADRAAFVQMKAAS